jgi:Cu/Zn superoxide dismutase
MFILALLAACDRDASDMARNDRNETPTVAAGTPATNTNDGTTRAERKAAEMLTYTARLEPRSGTTLAGTVTFNQDIDYDVKDVKQDQPGVDLQKVPAGVDDDVKVTIHLTGATPGEHAVYVTQMGDCSATDAASAGDWLPAVADGDKLKDGKDRRGNLGTVKVGADGIGHDELKVHDLRLGTGTGSIDGLGVVVYEKAGQDYKVDTMGARQACGVIRRDDTTGMASDAAMPGSTGAGAPGSTTTAPAGTHP